MRKANNDGVFPTVRADGGIEYVYYALRFNERGNCVSPKTRTTLIEDVEKNKYSDIFVFCHGWNNDWRDASDDLYTPFITTFHAIVSKRGLGGNRPYKPLWLGIHWPSAELVSPWRRGPEVAPADPARARNGEPALDALRSRLGEADSKRFGELMNRASLDAAQARVFAELLVKATKNVDDEGSSGRKATTDVGALLRAWASDSKEPGPVGSGEPGVYREEEAGTAEPEAAGVVFSGPRDFARLFTVWPMKDRAGLVGRNGIGPLLADLADAAEKSALRLLGHSFGTKALLSALGVEGFASHKAASALLLQPAISARCFATDAYRGQPGGYATAPSRVALPIVLTHSRDDDALYLAYHHAVCRRYDIGERTPAPEPGAAAVPLFAALGGHGPQGQGCDATRWNIKRPFDEYDMAANKVGTPLIALDGTGVIKNHGDVKNAATAWAQYYLMRTEDR